MIDLKPYAKTYYSQNGEDGVLEEIFKRLGISTGYFVDVGAWNGKYLSNTYLFVEKGWNGLEVEGNEKYTQQMKTILPPYIAIWPHYITPDGLENALENNHAPKEIDLLSIDIDTYDYWIWKNLKAYQAKVVVIETNSRPDYYIQPPTYGFKGIKGSSPSALRELGTQKGYTEVYFNGNLIFVRNDLYDNLRSHTG